jgi:replicative superfamily II helicase
LTNRHGFDTVLLFKDIKGDYSMTPQELIKNMAEVGAIQDELKKRAMVYQVSSKEDIAKIVGLPIDSLYHIAYEDYRRISSLVEIMKDKATKYYDLFEDEVKEYYRNNMEKMFYPGEAIVMGDIWNYYFAKNPVDLKVIRNSCQDAIDSLRLIC